MKNNENLIFEEAEKTVLFIHSANQFIIDETVTAEAVYIKMAKEGLRGTEKSEPYYLEEMRKAAKTDKKYLIMEFDPFICDFIETMVKTPGQYNFCHWKFCIFFHADTCPPGEEPNPMYNLNDDKLKILWPLYHSEFFYMYTIPVGHTLNISDLEKMRKDLTGPETVKELRRLEWNLRKGRKPERLSFPFYEIDEEKIREYIDRRLGEMIRKKKMATK